MSDEVLTVHILTLTDSQLFQFDRTDKVEKIVALYRSLGLLADNSNLALFLDGEVLQPETKLFDLPLIVDDIPNPILAFPCEGSPADYSMPYEPPNEDPEQAQPDSAKCTELATQLQTQEFEPALARVFARVCEEHSFEVALAYANGDRQNFPVEDFDDACIAEVKLHKTEWWLLADMRSHLYPEATPYWDEWDDSGRSAFFSMPEEDRQWIVEVGTTSGQKADALMIFRRNGRDRRKTMIELQTQ
jgi:hypothetical protein